MFLYIIVWTFLFGQKFTYLFTSNPKVKVSVGGYNTSELLIDYFYTYLFSICFVGVRRRPIKKMCSRISQSQRELFQKVFLNFTVLYLFSYGIYFCWSMYSTSHPKIWKFKNRIMTYLVKLFGTYMFNRWMWTKSHWLVLG